MNTYIGKFSISPNIYRLSRRRSVELTFPSPLTSALARLSPVSWVTLSKCLLSAVTSVELIFPSLFVSPRLIMPLLPPKVNQSIFTAPENTRYKSCFPVTLLMLQLCSSYALKPPVAATFNVPISVPVGLSNRSSIFGERVLATNALKVVAPFPKSIFLYASQSPFSIYPMPLPPLGVPIFLYCGRLNVIEIFHFYFRKSTSFSYRYS